MRGHNENREQKKNINVATDTSKRLCLSCRRLFRSDGSHHRICDSCKGHKAWSEGNPLYECITPGKPANDNGG